MNFNNNMTVNKFKIRGTFKNLSINKKLILGFGIILLILAGSIGLSAISIKKTGFQVERYYRYTVPNTNSTWKMRYELAGVQKSILQAILENDQESIKKDLGKADEHSKEFSDALEAFASNQSSHARDDDIAQIKSAVSQAASVRDEITEFMKIPTKENKTSAYKLYENSYLPIFNQVDETVVSFSKIQNQFSTSQKQESRQLMKSSWIQLSLILFFSILLTVFITYLIRKSILNPINEIDEVYKEIAKGNINARITYESHDELGHMAKNINATNSNLIAYINDITQKLKLLAQGDMDFTVDLDYIGNFEGIKTAILGTVSSLNHTMTVIDAAAVQVNTGAEQVSSGAQALAAGSTEQASSVEELTAAISNISSQAEENSENVEKASQYMNQTGQNVKNGSDHMKKLTEAMKNIDSASEQITKITKVIEDISFQTNILSLNAAIEAARAGTAGKGFSVVADEVRNLAAKSSEAAKQTAELIQNSVDTVREGTAITTQTAQILTDIDDMTNMTSDIINQINLASSEQSTSIEQIQEGLSQVSSVTQTNAATAEENSAASEEMSAQANTLRQEVQKFKLKKES